MANKDPRGYYRILGVEPSADAGEIKSAFRRKAMELHPDRNKAKNATEQFQLLNEAYGVLSDPETRAQYDTINLNTGTTNVAPAAAQEEIPDPIVCSCCGKVTAQPRYAIFLEVKSFIFVTTRSAIQGIFCSACAEKKSLKASAVTWLLGWWGLPWGPIYSLQALVTNMFGGKRPADINARLATHQAWIFAVLGKVDIARGIALDALELAKKVKTTEGEALQAQIQKLLPLLGDSGPGRLMNSWRLLRRPFYLQGTAITVVFGSIALAVMTASPSSNSYAYMDSSSDAKPYVSEPPPQADAQERPAYVRPTKAPNGKAWPTTAGYVRGYPRLKVGGLSEVTVDNSQNDSDVFVKLVSLDGPKAYPARSFFIPAYSSFTVEKVTAGAYDVRYMDLNTGALSRSEQFSVTTTETFDGMQYSTMTLTLYKVRNGNMQTYSLGENEF